MSIFDTMRLSQGHRVAPSVPTTVDDLFGNKDVDVHHGLFQAELQPDDVAVPAPVAPWEVGGGRDLFGGNDPFSTGSRWDSMTGNGSGPFGSSNPFGSNDPFGANGPLGSNDPFGGNNPFDKSADGDNPFGSNDPFGSGNPFGGNDPFSSGNDPFSGMGGHGAMGGLGKSDLGGGGMIGGANGGGIFGATMDEILGGGRGEIGGVNVGEAALDSLNGPTEFHHDQKGHYVKDVQGEQLKVLDRETEKWVEVDQVDKKPGTDFTSQEPGKAIEVWHVDGDGYLKPGSSWEPEKKVEPVDHDKNKTGQPVGDEGRDGGDPLRQPVGEEGTGGGDPLKAPVGDGGDFSSGGNPLLLPAGDGVAGDGGYNPLAIYQDASLDMFSAGMSAAQSLSAMPVAEAAYPAAASHQFHLAGITDTPMASPYADFSAAALSQTASFEFADTASLQSDIYLR